MILVFGLWAVLSLVWSVECGAGLIILMSSQMKMEDESQEHGGIASIRRGNWSTCLPLEEHERSDFALYQESGSNI
jgi:hypothetical protein